MKKQNWAILFVALLAIVSALSPYINKYESLGWISFGMILIISPYALYKALPSNRFSLLLSLSSPIVLGFSWGYWLKFYENYNLDTSGIITQGVVTATWFSRTRHGGKEKLFRVKFKTESDFREGFSHKNELDYHVGDSVLVEYLPTEPNTYRILR